MSILSLDLDFLCRVGGFSEEGAGTPEDLIFFFHHLRLGGRVLRHDDELLVYRYHPHATTFSVSEYVNNATVASIYLWSYLFVCFLFAAFNEHSSIFRFSS